MRGIQNQSGADKSVRQGEPLVWSEGMLHQLKKAWVLKLKKKTLQWCLFFSDYCNKTSSQNNYKYILAYSKIPCQVRYFLTALVLGLPPTL